MRIAIPLLIIAVVVISHLVVGRITQRRANERLDQIASWKHLPVEERLLAHTEFDKELICDDADRSRNAWTFCLSVAAAGLLMVVWLDDNTQATSSQAIANCRNFRSLVDILGDDLDQDIRTLSQDRSELADEVARTPGDVQGLPGYEDLPRAVQVFLRSLLSAQIAEGQEALASMDADLRRLRDREDVISNFSGGLDCPSS